MSGAKSPLVRLSMSRFALSGHFLIPLLWGEAGYPVRPMIGGSRVAEANLLQSWALRRALASNRRKFCLAQRRGSASANQRKDFDTTLFCCR